MHPPLRLSIPHAPAACSNSFSTQLLHPVGMWVNVNLMVPFLMHTEEFLPCPMASTPGCPIPSSCFPKEDSCVACLARQRAGLRARPGRVVDFLFGLCRRMHINFTRDEFVFNHRSTWLVFPAHGSQVVVKVLQTQRRHVRRGGAVQKSRLQKTETHN